MRPTFFDSPSAFRAWLEAHHATKTELLVGFHKRATGRPSLKWAESVDEALAFGWIDGVRKSLGEEAYTIRFTPRKATSTWSLVNVRRVEALTKLGRMQPAGLRAFAARSAARTGIYSFERREEAKLAPAEAKALRANEKAARFFAAQPPSYQRAALHWVVTAKRPETRARRLAALIDDSAAGRTVRHLTRPGDAKRAAAKKTAKKAGRKAVKKRA
jgi:uncharacterized protein YdeI (YjbR/CyaY-like superfamily)